MPFKITQYPAKVGFNDGDLFDVSSFDGVTTYTSEKMTALQLKTYLNSSLINNLGNSDQTLISHRTIFGASLYNLQMYDIINLDVECDLFDIKSQGISSISANEYRVLAPTQLLEFTTLKIKEGLVDNSLKVLRIKDVTNEVEFIDLDTIYEKTSNKGIANGYAGLDGGGKVPSSQLPSFVDDVLEFADFASFPVSGETGKIYIALDTNKTFRWSGSVYVEISTDSNIYNIDGILTGNRIVDVNNNTISFINSDIFTVSGEDIQLTTVSGISLNTVNITLTATSTQINGGLQINTTTPSVVGQVWTATGILGQGSWQASSGASSVGAVDIVQTSDGSGLFKDGGFKFEKLGTIDAISFRSNSYGANTYALRASATITQMNAISSLSWQLNGVDKMAMDSSGNVGIGIAAGSSGSKFFANGNAVTNGDHFIASRIANIALTGSIATNFAIRQDGTGKTTLNGIAGIRLEFAQGGVLKGFWDSAGNLVVGNDTDPAVDKLHVVGSVNTTTVYKVGGVTGFTGTGAYTNFTIVGGIITNATV